MTVSGTFGGKLELSTEVKVKVWTEVNIGFEAGLRGDCYFKITASPNANADNIIDWTTKFSGLIVTGYIKITTGRKGGDEETKKIKPITLIPSFTGNPISMVIGEGKTNKY